jgi:hypothetical protein
MVSHRAFVAGESPLREPFQEGPADPMAVMGAVREDIRQTLRSGWIDPGIEATAAHPVFLTTAWSAIRPNVGRSFLVLTRALRTAADQSVRAATQHLDLVKRLDGQLTGEERLRIEQCVKAAHTATAKAQIVVHALHRAARRDPLSGTGREEAPVRRGVPEWQRWMSFQPAPEAARPVLEEAAGRLDVPASSPPLRLLARWPAVLSALWEELETVCGTDAFRAGAMRLRRLVMAGVAMLPHPIDLQWTALKSRGFSDENRAALTGVLAWHDASMASQTMTAAFAWRAFGAPDIGAET